MKLDCPQLRLLDRLLPFFHAGCHNYHRTEYAYDQRGRAEWTLESTGTINRMVYDGFSRATSAWTCTDEPRGEGGVILGGTFRHLIL